ncbi:hypothetical protein J8L70_06915 [Pseudoalteromonas sp. MMG010]|uniref:DUF4144 family protein n=1 Tax=Pseudoalteromonas sp. MMG010 TaxID=2822685 RepID=UPI001B39E921|nr:DUF4144 family protein [Pseudoalteromonas sp. MMG010]MBQ4832966.1 hypothetical protein [Pseudoalteromonas sp. MMG010]
MNQLFPQIVFLQDDLEVVDTIQQRNEFLHNVTASEIEHVIVLTPQGHYYSLANKHVEPLTPVQLATVVTRYLANEGHCCLSKITQLTPSQAFTLLDI